MEIPCAKTNGAETSCSLNIEQNNVWCPIDEQL